MSKKGLFFLVAACMTLVLASCGYVQPNTSITDTSTAPTTSVSAEETTTETTSSTQPDLFADVTNYTLENPSKFTSPDAGFAVSYPEAWQIEVEPYEEASADHEASLMWGVRIFFDENSDQFIDVFKYQSQAKNLLQSNPLEFITSNMTRGKLSYVITNGEYNINIAFDDYLYHGIIIRVSEANFVAYKSQILGVLKSIEIDENQQS